MTVGGIDVASYQSTTFPTNGLGMVMVKGTEGTTYTNPHMTGQLATAQKGGCVRGIYHFLKPGHIADQVAYFLRQVPEEHQGVVLGVDWETPEAGPAATNAEKDEFIARLQHATRLRHRILLYCNLDFWLNRDKTGQCGDGLWIADPGAPAGHPRVQHSWTGHQYKVAGGIDQDVWNFADVAHLVAWANFATVATPKPPAPTVEQRLSSLEARVTALEKKG